MKYIRKKINEGFENPFNYDIQQKYQENNPTDSQNDFDEFGNIVDLSKRVKIRDIKLWNSNVRGKIVYDIDKKKMIAGRSFERGDIIEVCPYIELSDKDMYSENIRDASFTLNSSSRKFALPLGYALCYRNSMEVPRGLSDNISYNIDETNNTITFTATKRIRPGEELILFADDSDFQNELLPGQFKYDADDIDVIYSVKNYQMI